jgi:putative SOS response-associated peptidase YedK
MLPQVLHSGQIIQSCAISACRSTTVCWPTALPHLMMMLKPYPATAMEAYPVSTRVGSVKNTDAALFEPLEGNAALI